MYRGRRLCVTVGPGEVRYKLLDGDALEVGHHGENVALSAAGNEQSRPIPPAPKHERPTQPPGREPPLGHPGGV
jgi:alpha,alpha-trehalose phosphorylase